MEPQKIYINLNYSFDRDLVHSIARAISDEVRAKHNTANAENKYDYPYGLICWAPVLNICRDRKLLLLYKMKLS